MTPEETVDLLKKWLTEERLSAKAQKDPRAHAHFLVRYPSGKQGHMFAIVVPKGRDLVAVSSMTRVDEGQQKEMKEEKINMFQLGEEDFQNNKKNLEYNS